MSRSMKISGIYALIDPRTSEWRYIGQSENLRKRKSTWFTHQRDQYAKSKVTKWLLELETLNLQPIFHIIEACDESSLRSREAYWYGIASQFNSLLNDPDHIKTPSLKIAPIGQIG